MVEKNKQEILFRICMDPQKVIIVFQVKFLTLIAQALKSGLSLNILMELKIKNLSNHLILIQYLIRLMLLNLQEIPDLTHQFQLFNTVLRRQQYKMAEIQLSQTNNLPNFFQRQAQETKNRLQLVNFLSFIVLILAMEHLIFPPSQIHRPMQE